MTKNEERMPTRRTALIGLAAATVTTSTGALLGVDPVNAATTRTDKGFSSLQRAIDACKANDELRIQRAWLITGSVKVDKPLTIRCVEGGTVTTAADVHAFKVTASGVKLVNVRIAGSGSEAGTQSLIRADGTARVPLTGLIVRGCTLTRSRKNGVEMHHVSGFTIERNTVRSVAYGGIMIFSGKGGRIIHNKIFNVTQPRGFQNSYGIALTRSWDKPLSSAPRTTGTLVFGNLVDGVAKWEGIDTHGGVNITIDSNTVRNAHIGIAVVPCRDISGVVRYAPKGVTVKNNTVDSGVRNGTTRAGIQLVGAGELNSVLEYAQGVISRNTIIGFGYEKSSHGAGIVLYVTQKSIVQNNVLRESSVSGVLAHHNNVALSIKGNTMIDTWTNHSAFTACVYVASAHQNVTVRGNRASRAGKKAKKVNDRGTFISPTTQRPNVTVSASGNNFTACAMPLVYAANR